MAQYRPRAPEAGGVEATKIKTCLAFFPSKTHFINPARPVLIRIEVPGGR